MLVPVIHIARYALKIPEGVLCHGLALWHLPFVVVQINFHCRCITLEGGWLHPGQESKQGQGKQRQHARPDQSNNRLPVLYSLCLCFSSISVLTCHNSASPFGRRYVSEHLEAATAGIKNLRIASSPFRAWPLPETEPRLLIGRTVRTGCSASVDPFLERIFATIFMLFSGECCRQRAREIGLRGRILCHADYPAPANTKSPRCRH